MISHNYNYILFYRYRQRMIAFQLQYEGCDYYGFASQSGDCDDTIEKHVFDALLKLKLIDNREVIIYIID